jgi:5-methylcytosine-specific restriction endonuclease McrA
MTEKERATWRKWYAKNGAKARARSRKWYRDNLEKARLARQKNHAENRERDLKRVARWVKENPEKKRQSDARWRLANKTKKRVYNARWYREHSDRAMAAFAEKRAGKPVGFVKKADLDALKRRQKSCRVCGSVDRLEFDHKKPIAKGGRHVLSNLQILCRSCNRRKNNQWPWSLKAAKPKVRAPC